MKTTRLLPFLLLVLLFNQGHTPASPDREFFVAATPCDPVARHLLGIPADIDCEFIKWKLALMRDPQTDAPFRFVLNYTYGMTKAGTRGFLNDGTSKETGGKWSIGKNTGNSPGDHIFVLRPANQLSISLLRLDDNLLHLLDNNGRLMIGNAGFSYTFNHSKGI